MGSKRHEQVSRSMQTAPNETVLVSSPRPITSCIGIHLAIGESIQQTVSF
jgi:hypothetical protein